MRLSIHQSGRESLLYPRSRKFRRHTPLHILPLFSGTALGLSVALAARHRSALASPPWQVLVPPRRAPSKKARFGLGSRALREASPVCPEQIRRSITEEIIMYRNSVSLIGFAGKDAEARSTKNQKSYTVLSLATQSSYKDKKTGEYVNHTEWHRVIAWGKLSEFARKIQKGTHLSIDGALVSREFTDKNHKDVKHRIWEIRAISILKLDRAEKAGAEEPGADEFDPEEAAE
jgi:single-strand DNA-binding protein